MDWLKAAPYLGVAVGVIVGLMEAFADMKLTLTEGVGILKKAVASVRPDAGDHVDMQMQPNGDLHIVFKADLLKDIEVDLTK